MDKKRRRFVVLFLFLSVTITASVIFFLSLPKELVFADAESGKKYGVWMVTDGDEFSIEFIHSVNQSPVRDFFKIEGKLILPVATRFNSFGAGMQTDLEKGQKITRDSEGNMVITGFSQTFKELNYIVGTVSDHVLFIHNERISLRELCGKNAHIIIRVK